MRILSVFTVVVACIGCIVATSQAQEARDATLEITQASWDAGAGKRIDVTDAVKALVRDGRLEMKCAPDALGISPATSPTTKPAAGRQRAGRARPAASGMLTIQYVLAGKPRVAHFRAGEDIWISVRSREQVQREEQLAPKLAKLRAGGRDGLIVLYARFGAGNRWQDLTEILQSVVSSSGDSLTVPVNTIALGDPAPGAADKRLVLIYSLAGTALNTVEQGEGATVQVGPHVTAITAIGGGLTNVEQRLAELRKKIQSGLVVLDARFGEGNRWSDVTDKLQELVSGKDLGVVVSTTAFGDPAPGQAGKRLITIYADGDKIQTVETGDGATLKIGGDRITGVAAADGKLINLDQRLASMRKEYGDGLVILDARWGEGNRWGDVRELIQTQVINDAIVIDVGNGWPDTAPGATKRVMITWFDGKEIKAVTADQGSKLELKATRPEAIRSLAMLPRYAMVGRPIVHRFGGKGRFDLVKGPTGVKLSNDGELNWIPAAADVGLQELKVTIALDDKTYTQRMTIQVLSREISAGLGVADGDPAKLEAAMRLDLGESGCTAYRPSAGFRSALLLQDENLLILGADGTSISRRLKLPAKYSRVVERDDYFVLLSSDSKAIDLLDKSTLERRRRIRLPYQELMDLAALPDTPVCYVAVKEQVDDGPQYRVIVVDETNGDVREPKNVIGRFLAVDPGGRFLYTGYKDTYQKGVSLFMNPDGRIWDTPQYGDIDLLMVYELADPSKPKLMSYKERPGENGSGLHVSPDGARLTYTSWGGYPRGTHAVPAWDPTDLEKKPACYEVNGKGDSTKMAYHPSLPLVAVPSPSGALLFDRESADSVDSRVFFPAGELAGARINQIYFSPDGKNLVIECERDGAWWLQKCPLMLSEAERQKVEQGVRAPRRAPRVAPDAEDRKAHKA